jgi:hypothetical protein
MDLDKKQYVLPLASNVEKPARRPKHFAFRTSYRTFLPSALAFLVTPFPKG